MSKKSEEVVNNPIVDEPQQQAKQNQPAESNGTTAITNDFVDKLKAKGFAMLTANTLDDLASMVSTIPADIRYASGAVGRTREGDRYTLRIDIVKH
jgi:hypothetical protein